MCLILVISEYTVLVWIEGFSWRFVVDRSSSGLYNYRDDDRTCLHGFSVPDKSSRGVMNDF